MLSWRNDQVLLWLKNSQQPDNVVESFRTHNITGLTLPMLNSQELKEMGILDLRMRLKILSDISTLIIEKNTGSDTSLNMNSADIPASGIVNMSIDHPLISELQASVISTSLIKSISSGIIEETSTKLLELSQKKDLENHLQSAKYTEKDDRNYKVLLSKINKLKEEILPVLKEIQDKKPLPTPSGGGGSGSVIGTPTELASPARSTFNKYTNSSDKFASQSPENSVTSPTSHNFSYTNSQVAPKLTTKRSSKRISTQYENLEPTISTPNIGSFPTNIQGPPQTPPASANDTLRQLRAKTEDPCYKILQSAMRSHRLDKSEWRKYVLVICYGGDKERVLRYDEKPVVVFKELNELGLSPSMMLRQVEEFDDTGDVNNDEYDTPGGRL